MKGGQVMRNKTFASLAVASALGLLTPVAHAFGLGKLELHSALNEPFKAEIAVTALQGEEAESLQIKLASNKEFEKAGLDRSFVLTGLEFNVVQEQGVTYISVSSELPIKEPLLDFLVIATTGEGRLLREYTVLLDPPKHVFKKPTKQVSSQTSKKAAEKPKTTKPAKKAQTTSYDYGQTTQTSYNSGTYGPIATNDTLWGIALKTRPEKSLSVNQMMIALLEANPNAFHRNNINGLKAGVTLDIPSLSTIQQLSKKAATTAVAEQNTTWENRNIKPAVPVPAETISMEASDTAAQVGDSQETTKIDTPVSVDVTQDETTSRLKLVVPSDEESINDETLSPQGDDDLSQLSEQLTFAQETIEAQAQENIDFKARMEAMEEQLETMRRILELKDPDLARLQSMLQEEQGSESVDNNAQAIVEEALAVLEQSPAEKLEPVLDETSADKNIEAYLDSLTTEESEASGDELAEINNENDRAIENSAPVLDVEEESVLPTIDEVVTTTSELLNIDEAEVQNIISQVKSYVAENKMTTMLASLVILLAIWLLIRRRNRPNVTWDEAIENYDNDNDDSKSVDIAAASDTTVEEEGVEAEDTANDQLEDIVDEKTVDDYIKQADMFVGYADYTQAKSSLEQARTLEPDNHRIASKMCFVLYKQKNVDEFINLVQQTGFDFSSSEWTDIAEWGRELAPENELFFEDELTELNEETGLNPETELPNDEPVVEAIDDSESEAEHLEFNLNDFETEDTVTESFNEEQVTEEISELTTDDTDELMTFDIAEGGSEQEDAVTEETETAVEFDAPLTLDVETDESSDEAADLSLNIDEGDDESLEFESLDMGDTEAVSDDVAEQDELESLAEEELEEASNELNGSAMVEFDLDDIDEIDEAETKLDLASAYIDMGDPDGAKSILDEVLKEGNEEQQSRAQKTLDDLS
jgi:pilus assembly protein FimV